MKRCPNATDHRYPPGKPGPGDVDAEIASKPPGFYVTDLPGRKFILDRLTEAWAMDCVGTGWSQVKCEGCGMYEIWVAPDQQGAPSAIHP